MNAIKLGINRMRKTLTVQLGVIIIGIMVAMLVITSIATYKTAYDKLYDAAGIEAYGCANITTGLINPGDVVKIIDGDIETIKAVGKQLNWTTAHKDIFETQYIVDLEGKILALDDNFIDKGLKPGDIVPIDQEAINELLESRHPTYSKLFNFAGMERLSGYAPIFENHDQAGEIIAISVIDFDGAIVGERTWDVVRNGILISLIPMIIASIFTIYLIRRKTGQISALIAHAKEIADGNLAIKDIEVKSKDEVGDLAHTLNTMTANLHTMITTMKSTASQLTENSVGTATSLYEMQTAIQQVANNMCDVTVSISSGTTSADHASVILKLLASDIQNAKEAADSSVTNSKETMHTANEGQQRASEISVDMEKIRTASVDTRNTIQDLIESTTKIQNITASIAGIAAQTNLLALNASIEAARAGEHGLGFAVVADEVRKLAEQSNKEVLEVEKLIRDITSRIELVVETTAESTALIEVGSDTANLTAQSLSNISSAVANTVDEISKISELTATEAEESKQVVELISNLTEVIHEIEDMTTDVSAATEETTASIDEVTNRSIETSEMARKLEKVVNQFTL